MHVGIKLFQTHNWQRDPSWKCLFVQYSIHFAVDVGFDVDAIIDDECAEFAVDISVDDDA